MNFTIGADPEVILVDSNNTPVPSTGLLGGTKRHPVPIPGGGMQEDNVLAEINPNPADNEEDFINNVTTCLQSLKDHAENLGLSVSIIAGAMFPENILEHSQSRKFGCHPDYNVWTLKKNVMLFPEDSYRVCSGNIHIGCDRLRQNPEYMIRVVKALDAYVGLPLLKELGTEESYKRLEYYGKWGSYRSTRYGIEYRVPDNSWLKSPKYMSYVYRAVNLALGRPTEYFPINAEITTTKECVCEIDCSVYDMLGISDLVERYLL